MISLGGNSERVGDVIGLMGSLASVLAQNPSEPQQKLISEKVNALLNEGINFVKSQPGLENVENDPDILNDPQFKPFLNYYNELVVETDYMQNNPRESFDYFSKISEKYANFFSLLVQTSKKVQAKKASTCKIIEKGYVKRSHVLEQSKGRVAKILVRHIFD